MDPSAFWVEEHGSGLFSSKNIDTRSVRVENTDPRAVTWVSARFRWKNMELRAFQVEKHGYACWSLGPGSLGPRYHLLGFRNIVLS